MLLAFYRSRNAHNILSDVLWTMNSGYWKQFVPWQTKTKIKQTCFDIPPVQQFANLTSIGAKSDLPAAPY